MWLAAVVLHRDVQMFLIVTPFSWIHLPIHYTGHVSENFTIYFLYFLH